MSSPSLAALPAFWLNGVRQEAAGPHLSARDRGFLLADGVFETMHVHGGRIFRLNSHLARLTQGLEILDIPVPPDLRDWVMDAVRSAGQSKVSVRLSISRGTGPGGLLPPENLRPTALVSVSPFPVFPPAIYTAGLTAHIASGRRNERSMTNGLKVLAYTDAVVALLEAQRAGAQEALFLDSESHCSEATSSNLFAWAGGTLVTPPGSCGALPGVTRAAVLEIARTLAIPSATRILTLEELLAADEAFLTSSLRGVAPLVAVGKQPIGRGVPGELTARISEAYAELVARECGT